ncbi:unannotated protein [freshwater metagenome]|uniref:Unannotated protein n=1 Tax=freshwater metagenome TaxID=449393 RepID=A0A6J7QN16_9ZZZZ
MSQSAPERLWCDVDQLNLIDPRQERVGDGVEDRPTGDSFNEVAHRFDVTDPECGDDVDARRGDPIHVAPPCASYLVGAPGAGKVVDQHHTGMTGQHGVGIEAMCGIAHQLEPLEHRRGLTPPVGVDGTDHHVGPTVGSPATLGQHCEGCADASSCSEIHADDASTHDSVDCGRSAGSIRARTGRVRESSSAPDSSGRWSTAKVSSATAATAKSHALRLTVRSSRVRATIRPR